MDRGTQGKEWGLGVGDGGVREQGMGLECTETCA